MNIIPIVSQARDQGVILGKHLHFHLGIEPNNIYALEVNTRTFINLGTL
jgi:hypothetical protein